MKYIVDIKGEIEGDYEIIGKYEERLPEAFASAQPEIIRCKDCVHCADDWNGNQPMFTCELGIYDGSVDPYYFCSMAELRGEVNG